MKNSIFKLGIFIFLFVAITGCQNDEIETYKTTENIPSKNVAEQFVSTKNISNNQQIKKLVNELVATHQNQVTTKRVGCTLDSDIGCGSDAAEEIEEYINLSNCISFTRGTLIFPVQALQYTYNYSYYIDSDGDINMDQYQYQFDSHVADIESRIAPKKIAFVSADASNACGRRWKVSNIIYTVILGD